MGEVDRGVLIIGLGDIGSAVAQALKSKWRLRAYDCNSAAGLRVAATDDIQVLPADHVPHSLPGEIVIDCTRGASAPTLRAVLLDRAARTVIHFSSFAVYGQVVGQSEVGDDHPLHPITDYGADKLEEELALRRLGAETGVATLALRLSGFAGLHLHDGSSKSTLYAHAAMAEMTRLRAPTGSVNLSEYIDELRFRETMSALVERVAAVQDPGWLPPTMNIGGGAMMSNAHAATMFEEATGITLGSAEPPPPPQLPRLSLTRLSNFLGAEAFDRVVRATPFRSYWSALAANALGGNEVAQ